MLLPTVKKQFASTQSFRGYRKEDFEQTPIVPIATVEQYPEEIGASGVDELLYNAAHPESPHVGEILIEADLLHTELIPDLSFLKT